MANQEVIRMNFTLSQLLLVCFCIGLLLSIFVPYILRRTIENNEARAIGTLRILSTSQEQFNNGSVIDQNLDGGGEFGLLGELAGTSSRRGGGPPVKPTFITPVLGPTGINNYAIKLGYRFQVHLLGPSATVTDNGTKGLSYLSCKKCLKSKHCKKCNAIINAQETHYRIYAWPDKLNFSGVKCFAVDQASRGIAIAPNEDTSYGGDNAPTFGAAIGNRAGWLGFIDGKNIAKDGQKWGMLKINK